MPYEWEKLLILQLLVLFIQPWAANGACCPPRFNKCDDGTISTPCCGIHRCNIFCCTCTCRKSKSRAVKSKRHNTYDCHRHKRKHSHAENIIFGIRSIWNFKSKIFASKLLYFCDNILML
ncbi:uncharacterized protein LOC117781401 [Drosophila innubila]|uniref:uncharacterized protein LOC117781401 n=1 Tax=Drosophila innubila TaxID=198719 RepID=UPI00148E339E|nr:uncharacterized protein LOC117781401 [Drosophila innubila]